jgi:hypothetical protein
MTIKQKTVAIDIDGGKRVTVKRMRWKAARQFLGELARCVADICGDGKGAKLLSAAGSDEAQFFAELQGILDRLSELVQESDSLMMLLATESTDMTAEQIDDLDVLSASEILKAAFEVNMDADLKNCWTGMLGSLRAFMPAKKTS